MYLRERWVTSLPRYRRNGCMIRRLPPPPGHHHPSPLGLGSPFLLQIFLVLLRDPRERLPTTSTVAGVHDIRHRNTYRICPADLFFDSGRCAAGCRVPLPKP